MDPEQVLRLLQEYPLPPSSYYSYGTAGFRYAANVLEPVMVRVGLASLFLLLDDEDNKSDNNNMGVMITASHNDESYNGVKLSAPDGSMISSQGEHIVVQWVNERDVQVWKNKLQTTLQERRTPLGTLHVARDTRSHSIALQRLVLQGAQAMGVTTLDLGVMTTPMLHWIVRRSNLTTSTTSKYPATAQGYYQQLANAYSTLNDLLEVDSNAFPLPPLQVDGACGVGYPALQQLIRELSLPLQARFIARNPPNSGPLNELCGSEFVQKQLQPPKWFEGETQIVATSSDYCCSLDGDSDRIVFWKNTSTNSENNLLLLLDGDKIAVLWARFFKSLALPSQYSMGVIQTAYANGASTDYLQNTLQVPVTIAKTGVKHLHHAALQYDIGIYFEANGHGTVLFSKRMQQELESPLWKGLQQLINPAVGDALSDLLLVDLLLRKNQWTLDDWYHNLYQDLPSRQLKVQVQDRTIIQCNDNETRTLTPASLQAQLDEIMARIPAGRCFVRPSGTENVVRIYAEASTRLQADTLAMQAAKIVHDTCDGIGPIPKI